MNVQKNNTANSLDMFLSPVAVRVINLLLTVVVISIIAAYLLAFSRTHSQQLLARTDFPAYYIAAKMVLTEERSSFYDVSRQFKIQKEYFPAVSYQLFYPFRNPPFLSLLFIPLALFSPFVGFLLYIIVNIGFVFSLTTIIIKLLRIHNRALFITILLSLFAFLPIGDTITLAQPSILFPILILKAYTSFQEHKKITSGLWLSLLFIKPQFLLIPIIFFFISKQFKILLGILLGVCALTFFSFVIIGVNGMQAYIQFLIATGQGQDPYSSYRFFMQTIFGFTDLLFLGKTNGYYYFFLLFLIGITIVCAMYVWKKQSSEDLGWSALFISCVLLSPFAHPHDLTILIATNTLTLHWIIQKRSVKKFSIFSQFIFIQTILLFFHSLFRQYIHIQITVLVMLINLIILFAFAFEKKVPALHC